MKTRKKKTMMWLVSARRKMESEYGWRRFAGKAFSSTGAKNVDELIMEVFWSKTNR